MAWPDIPCVYDFLAAHATLQPRSVLRGCRASFKVLQDRIATRHLPFCDVYPLLPGLLSRDVLTSLAAPNHRAKDGPSASGAERRHPVASHRHAGSIQAGDDVAAGVEDLGLDIGLETRSAAEHAGTYDVGIERRCDDGAKVFATVEVGVNAGLAVGVPFLDCFR